MFSVECHQTAASQYGTITSRQLLDCGSSRSSISRARRSGLLIEILPGIFRFASSRDSFLTRCMAVQHATAPVGYLSGWTAARLAGLRKMPRQPIHVTTPVGTRRSLADWVECHRSRWYDTSDRTIRPDGLIVAHPMRMLFALAAAFNQYRFERAAEDAWHLGLVTPTDALEYLEAHRCRGKDGVSTMERWLERALRQDRPAQSGLEQSLLQALEERGLPSPVRQHPLVLPDGSTVHLDIAWPDIRLAVEPGSSWWHGGDDGQRQDQERDRACSEVGWLTLRFDETIAGDTDRAADQVARIHRRRTADFRHPHRA
jgi:very-short-patch-repair endonuclease